MKNFIFIIAFMFCTAMSFAQTAKDLIGKWALTGIAQMEKMDKETQEQFKKAIQFNMDLKKDNKFVLSSQDKVMTGTWTLKGKVLQFISADKKKNPLTFTISKYLKDELRILVKEQEFILGRIKSK